MHALSYITVKPKEKWFSTNTNTETTPGCIQGTGNQTCGQEGGLMLVPFSVRGITVIA